jgi:hypothetical protein
MATHDILMTVTIVVADFLMSDPGQEITTTLIIASKQNERN